MSDRTGGELDRAVAAYREDPTDANRARLDAAQRAHVIAFYAELTGEFIARTSGN
jgi:hypothetical protein